ncbi:MAG: hypothetical protein ABEJ22_02095 [Haloferacaceae archaeon]
MKMWTCTQCGAEVTQGILASIRDPPTACENCGNSEFEETSVTGVVHSLVDQFVA